MPRREVVECICDRCERKWYPDSVQGAQPAVASCTVSFISSGLAVQEAKFEVLCSVCEKAVAGYLDHVFKDMKHKSPKRGAKKKAVGQVAEATRPAGNGAHPPAARPSR